MGQWLTCLFYKQEYLHLDFQQAMKKSGYSGMYLKPQCWGQLPQVDFREFAGQLDWTEQ